MRGKRTTIYHTISLGKFAIDPPKRYITAATSGAWIGMSVPGGFGSATPATHETFQAVTEFKWNPSTGQVIAKVGAGEKYNAKMGINIVNPFSSDLVLIWDKTEQAYVATNPEWITGVTAYIAAKGQDVEYKVNNITDCVLSVGGHRHMKYNLAGMWLKECIIFEDDPKTP